MRSPRRLQLTAVSLSVALLAAACGGDDEDVNDISASATESETPAENDVEDPESEDSADEEPSDDTTADTSATSSPVGCADDLFAPGTLTVATGEVVFAPWMVDDDPTNGKGFESALVYALAEELGLDVTWVRTGFDEAIAPGSKDYDFNVQQYSITPQRDEAVDFSEGYYTVQQAVIGAADGDIADVETLADLAQFQLGAALGTTSLDYIDEQIQPADDALVFDDNAASKAAFDANQVDGIVYDLPTAYYITAVEIPEAAIIGTLPVAGQPEELGFLFEEGSPLVDCIDNALTGLAKNGTLDALQTEWLAQGGDIVEIAANSDG